jgi:hypothetical protein
LATGKNNDTTGGADATSTNQTLANNFGNYEISLDQAYVVLNTTDITSITLGKMKNPFWAPQKSQLIWDGDITPEGIAGKYSNGNWFATLSHLYLDSQSRGDSNLLTGVQVGAKYGSFAGAIAYYSSSSDPAAATAADLTSGAEFLNLGLEYGFKIGDLKAAIYGNYAVNQDESNNANVDDDAFEIGLNVKGGAWKAGLAYLDVGNEGDTGLQNSDFNGMDDDLKGYKIGAAYGFSKNASAGLTYYAWEDNQSVAGATNRDQNTLQADLKFKF